jgi:hypothetical protein
MVNTDLTETLNNGETLRLSWDADSVTRITDSGTEQVGHRGAEWVFGATDERLVYLEDGNEVRELDYADIQSVENADARSSRSNLQKLLVFYGAFLTGLGLYVLFEGNREFGAVGFLVGVASLVVGAMMEFGLTDAVVDKVRTRFEGPAYDDGADTVEQHTIRFVTDAETKQALEVTTEADVVTELSDILQNYTTSRSAP